MTDRKKYHLVITYLIENKTSFPYHYEMSPIEHNDMLFNYIINWYNEATDSNIEIKYENYMNRIFNEFLCYLDKEDFIVFKRDFIINEILKEV